MHNTELVTKSEEAAILQATQRFQDSSIEADSLHLAAAEHSDLFLATDADGEIGKSGDTLNEVIKDTARRNKLIDDNNLLKGIVMTRKGPESSSRELIKRPNTLNASINNESTVETFELEDEYSGSLLKDNYNSVSASVSSPFVTANAEYTQSSSFKNTWDEKTIFMSSHYLFPQGRIDFTVPGTGFSDEVQLSDGFMTSVNNALKKATRTEQREALYSIFEDYGHVFRTKVQIGGVLSGNTIETIKRTENEAQVKHDIKVGLEASVKGWGASVSAGHGDTKDTVETAQKRRIEVQYVVNGGDVTKIQQTPEWIASTNKSEYWRVIQVVEVIPVEDMLPVAIRTTVKNLMKPLLGKWVSAKTAPTSTDPNLKLPISFPDIPKVANGWFWLGFSADQTRALLVKPTLPTKHGRNPALTTGKAMAYGPNNLGGQEISSLDPSIPQYRFLSFFNPGYIPANMGEIRTTMAALRPDLVLEGEWVNYGTPTANHYVYFKIDPIPSAYPEDKCFDLMSIARIAYSQYSTYKRHYPPMWVVKESSVWFDSEEN